MSDLPLSEIGLLLVIFGVILAFLAAVLVAVRSAGGGRTRGAGVLLIGPIPIIFGSDRESVKLLVVFAIVLMAVVLLFLLLPSLLSR